MPKKLVISSHNLRSQALKNLQVELSEQVGYKVWRVRPERVRRRIAAHFDRGLDKLTQLQAFKNADVPSPAFATSAESATTLPGNTVVLRKLLKSSEGKGIEMVEKAALNPEVHKAPLYTQYIPKKAEYRAHVYNNKVIDLQQKKKRAGYEGQRDTKVRNTANGYVFCRDNIFIPNDLAAVALAAVQALGRTQGAVDIIYNEKQNKCYALEVNARPGMQGTTLKSWSKAILETPNIKRV
jgi:glutathione synthase/RimK-type ligase-like ATP-grasp enzyme